MSGGLLVAGVSSDAGKSVLVAGLCRWLHRSGVRVAPFKAMNMSNNSVVALDGGEIGRAQAAQAAACGLDPVTAMNPVLLKPGSDRHSHVLVRGREVARVGADGMAGLHAKLMGEVLAAYDELAAAHDVVVCEGAGGAAEINLRDRDLANLGLAGQRGLPVLVVGDVDRGGVFAGLFGTLALLSGADQDHVAGFVVNKFRGDAALLAPGLDTLTDLTGRPVLGVLPWFDGPALDVEDSLSRPTAEGPSTSTSTSTSGTLRVVAVPLPRTSNSTDLDALACEPGVSLRWSAALPELADADLVVLPGTRATVADLDWLRRTGIADVIVERARRRRPILGICGGYQLLAGDLHDEVESGAGQVAGLGLLPVDVHFAAT
ncbi:MAG: cobyric acid synthase, partial [Kineosporiaceae bacterium]